MASAGAETVYETESPTIPDTKPKPDKPTNNSKDGSSEGEAEKSDTPVGGGTESGGGGTGGGSPETGTDGGTGQTSPGNGSKAGGDISQAEAVKTPAQGSETKPVENTGATSDDGGSSSPLVPILIAIAVLAAISIGVVVMRQRRRPGTPVSPKAS